MFLCGMCSIFFALGPLPVTFRTGDAMLPMLVRLTWVFGVRKGWMSPQLFHAWL